VKNGSEQIPGVVEQETRRASQALQDFVQGAVAGDGERMLSALGDDLDYQAVV
jgi:hypothetical protein